MSQAKAQAAAWIKRGIEERVDELTEQWLAEDDQGERERLHAHARATIELEDKLNARIAEYAAE